MAADYDAIGRGYKYSVHTFGDIKVKLPRKIKVNIFVLYDTTVAFSAFVKPFLN